MKEPIKVLSDVGFGAGQLVTVEGLNQIKRAMFVFARDYAYHFTGGGTTQEFDDFEKLYKSNEKSIQLQIQRRRS